MSNPSMTGMCGLLQDRAVIVAPRSGIWQGSKKGKDRVMALTDLSKTTSSAYLETGVRMHYYDVGEGSDTLVLLHGFPQTSWQWRHVIEPFAQAGYRVIAPDYRGAGNSSRPRKDHGYPADLRGDVILPRGCTCTIKPSS